MTIFSERISDWPHRWMALVTFSFSSSSNIDHALGLTCHRSLMVHLELQGTDKLHQLKSCFHFQLVSWVKKNLPSKPSELLQKTISKVHDDEERESQRKLLKGSDIMSLFWNYLLQYHIWLIYGPTKKLSFWEFV